jgi:thiol-disulfide isomerase/thioredoxin
MIDWKKYLLVFLITSGIFISAIFLSNYFNGLKLSELKAIQDKVSIDILSSETQYDLLAEMSCSEVTNSSLNPTLSEVAEKIQYSEKNLGNNEEIKQLKKSYSLLEIKDYLLMKKISARCGFKNVFILYFYTTAENCNDCVKEGLVLDALREKYPAVRVYSFDYNLIELSAVKAMTSIYKIKDTALPALVIDGNVYTGFQDVETIESIKPSLKTLLPKTEVKK